MKSRINSKDRSFYLTISLRTWVYIMGLIRLDLDKNHTPVFKTWFHHEFSELEELRDFEPPFKFPFGASVSLKFK